jgi:hypothetical protein
VGSSIPVGLIIIGENREAFDLVAAAHVVDVRLFKVMAFGENARVNCPFTLRDRNSYHRTDLVAEARWDLDVPTQPKELPADEAHPRSRWCIRINGEFRRKQGVEMCASFDNPLATWVIKVCSFNLVRDLAPTDVFHSTLRASTQSVRHSSDLQVTRESHF